MAKKSLVVKIGSSTITTNNKEVNTSLLSCIVNQIVQHLNQYNILLITSGAVAAGLKKLDISTKIIKNKQVLASIGQPLLMETYKNLFEKNNVNIGQILVTHDDLFNRKKFLNLRFLINEMLNKNIVPIINENDVLADEELKLGDNDTIAALISNIVEAEKLILLTDQDGLYDKDPRKYKKSKLIRKINTNDKNLGLYAQTSKSSVGSGGMATKIRAAKIAARSNTCTYIANGKEEDIITKILNSNSEFSQFTLILPSEKSLLARQRWLHNNLNIKGRLVIDDGAQNALSNNKSLLPSGVINVIGEFERGDIVCCYNKNNTKIAQGIINYSSKESCKILGKKTVHISNILGFINEEELIHKNNLVLQNH